MKYTVYRIVHLLVLVNILIQEATVLKNDYNQYTSDVWNFKEREKISIQRNK